MIKFTCEHCQQNIRVADTAAGKTGRCPGCKQPVTVPELAMPDLSQELKLVSPDSIKSNSAAAMLRYDCRMCRKPLTAPSADEGKIKECPHCGCFVEVPVSQKPPAHVDNGIRLQPPLPKRDEPGMMLAELSQKSPVETELPPGRLLPVFIDVFLFPLNKSGLLALLAFTLAPIVLYPIAFLGVFGPLLYLCVMVCVWAYMFWYVSLCIHKSAEGHVRAPGTFNEDMNTGMGDMVLQLFRTILLILVCLLPAFIFRVVTDSAGAVFYGLLAGGIFFLPMMLLASVMFDSFWAAWNPRVVLGGMFSSFFAYIGLVLTFYIPVGLYFYISQLGRSQENMPLAVVLNGCSIYLILVSSHLLGWFFHKNEEKLYWSV